MHLLSSALQSNLTSWPFSNLTLHTRMRQLFPPRALVQIRISVPSCTIPADGCTQPLELLVIQCLIVTPQASPVLCYRHQWRFLLTHHRNTRIQHWVHFCLSPPPPAASQPLACPLSNALTWCASIGLQNPPQTIHSLQRDSDAVASKCLYLNLSLPSWLRAHSYYWPFSRRMHFRKICFGCRECSSTRTARRKSSTSHSASPTATAMSHAGLFLCPALCQPFPHLLVLVLYWFLYVLHTLLPMYFVTEILSLLTCSHLHTSSAWCLFLAGTYMPLRGFYLACLSAWALPSTTTVSKHMTPQHYPRDRSDTPAARVCCARLIARIHLFPFQAEALTAA